MAPKLEGKLLPRDALQGAEGQCRAHSRTCLFCFRNNLLEEVLVLTGTHTDNLEQFTVSAGAGVMTWKDAPGWRPSSALGNDTGHIPWQVLALPFCCLRWRCLGPTSHPGPSAETKHTTGALFQGR